MGPNETELLVLLHRLRETIGEQEAASLMNSLPPYEWPEVATKSDLAAVEQRILGALDARIAQQTRTLMLAMTGFALSIWLALLVPVLVA
ncbi:hypothetical protein [Candidatus Poriferisodalis sp.]|uniref:hypothetical protein n=1 Tax=Candidatus Poriferisodalis sp. TaxID=3101277 RepID=UPI003B028B34